MHFVPRVSKFVSLSYNIEVWDLLLKGNVSQNTHHHSEPDVKQN